MVYLWYAPTCRYLVCTYVEYDGGDWTHCSGGKMERGTNHWEPGSRGSIHASDGLRRPADSASCSLLHTTAGWTPNKQPGAQAKITPPSALESPLQRQLTPISGNHATPHRARTLGAVTHAGVRIEADYARPANFTFDGGPGLATGVKARAKGPPKHRITVHLQPLYVGYGSTHIVVYGDRRAGESREPQPARWGCSWDA